MRITANVKPVGESLLPVTPAAHQVVTDWRASKKGAADDEVSTNEGLALLPMSFSVGHTIFLECFAGTGSVGKIAETIPGSKVVSIDIHAETMGYKPTIVADILKVDFNNLGFDPDFLWMSPPCQTFSIMGAGKHRSKSNMEPKTKDGRLGDQILSHTVDAINILARKNPNMKWYMENPVGLMQYSPIIELLPPHTLATVSYCQYGFDYQKNTHIWTNDIEWAKKKAKKCSPSCPKMKNGKHEYGVKKHPHMKGAPKSLEERYQMPPALIEEILGTHHRLGDDVTVSTVGDAKDDARNSRLEELDDKIERLTPTVSPVAGGTDVDELSLGMANASISRQPKQSFLDTSAQLESRLLSHSSEFTDMSSQRAQECTDVMQAKGMKQQQAIENKKKERAVKLRLKMGQITFDDAREGLKKILNVPVMTADQWANDAVMFPEFLKCHTCLKTTTDDDGAYFEENMWICYPCVYRIRDGEIGSPR